MQEHPLMDGPLGADQPLPEEYGAPDRNYGCPRPADMLPRAPVPTYRTTTSIVTGDDVVDAQLACIEAIKQLPQVEQGQVVGALVLRYGASAQEVTKLVNTDICAHMAEKKLKELGKKLEELGG